MFTVINCTVSPIQRFLFCFRSCLPRSAFLERSQGGACSLAPGIKKIDRNMINAVSLAASNCNGLTGSGERIRKSRRFGEEHLPLEDGGGAHHSSRSETQCSIPFFSRPGYHERTQRIRDWTPGAL